MNLAEWLIRTARRLPQAPALMSGDRVVADYADFARGAASLAAAMRDRFGVAPGDRVAIFMSNRAEYLEILYGVWFCGAAVVPINCKLHAKEAAWIIENAEAKLVFVSDEVVNSLAPITDSMANVKALLSVESRDYVALRRATPMAEPVLRDCGDLAWLFYTSGTTGKPKGVMISNGNLAGP